MVDSDDDDIIILEDKSKPSNKAKWTWTAPNPRLKKEETEQRLQNVRAKLNMQIPLISSPADTDSKSSYIAQNAKKSKTVRKHKLEDAKASHSLLQTFHKTPEKACTSNAPMSLTPEQILELTENCLDSDNEPEITPVKSSPHSHQQENTLSRPKRSLDFGVKASSSLRNKASKFFGAGTSGLEVEEILSQEILGPESPGKQRQGSHSPTKSPSRKKKRLSKNSPVRLLPSHQALGKSPGKQSPTKRRSGSLSPLKTSPLKKGSASAQQNLDMEEHLTIAEGPYYFEAFCFMIQKVSSNVEYNHLFLEAEHKKIEEVSNEKKELQLYVRLMNRKDKWNRCSDVKYNDISADLSPLFDSLERQNLITCDLNGEKLDELLYLLKLEDLKLICDKFKVKKSGPKSVLVGALMSMHRTQPTLNGMPSPLQTSVVKLLGRCARLTAEWRLVFRRCMLLFSLFHSHEELDKISSEQALLLLQIKLGNMTLPMEGLSIKPSAKIFANRDQLIRYEEAKELKQALNMSIEMKNSFGTEDLTTRGMKQFSTLLELTSEAQHVLQLPQFLQRFCAGSVYAYALTNAINALKQAKKYNLALEVLRLLSKQKTYSSHYYGRWALMQSEILHINQKDLVGASKMLCAALRNRSLNSVDRMHLQQRAEKVYNLKKNGLSKACKLELGKVIDPPNEIPDAVEISARAYLSSKPGLKKIYIRDTEDGKEFMSVEETVIAHYKSLGFIYGVHDEGSTISSLCLLSLWDCIYDPTVPGTFQSPYQDKPLDWGSKAFYESRKSTIEAKFSHLLDQDIKEVAQELCDIRTKHGHKTSVINWDRLERLNILAFLECVSVPVYIAIARRFVSDWKSHRSGFPDLVIWSPPQKKCLFVEVKSPNDKLSTVQCLWLDFLKKSNAVAIVAHIKESGSKGSHCK